MVFLLGRLLMGKNMNILRSQNNCFVSYICNKAITAKLYLRLAFNDTFLTFVSPNTEETIKFMTDCSMISLVTLFDHMSASCINTSVVTHLLKITLNKQDKHVLG